MQAEPSITSGQALTEVSTEAVPEAVDSELFEMLRAELARVLIEQQRSTAVAPEGTYNAVTDLVLTGDAGSGWRLEWTCHNRGDYDRNGEVNAGDMVPIAVNYLANSSSADWISAQLADGDGNGEVNASDITPIGQNYAAFVAGYRIRGADTVDGPQSLVAEVDLPASPEVGAWLVSYELPSRDFEFYFVEPVDSGGISGEPGWGSLPYASPAVISPGIDVIETSQVIDPAGGSITGPPDSAIEGISIEFAAGSLGDSVEIGLGYNDGSVGPADGVFRPPIIEIDDGGHGQFLAPVEITIPISGELGLVPVMYNVNDDGSLSAMRFVEIDYGGNTATFSTMHASGKAVIDARHDFDSLEQISGKGTDFKPGLDGFQIKNYGSSMYRSGECMGMVAFAKWYFSGKKFNSHGRLFTSFMQQQGRQWWVYGISPPPLYVQDHIATRAHTAILIPYYEEYADQDAEKRSKPDPEHFGMIRGALLETGQPILLGLFSQDVAEGHSTLCYSFGPAPKLLGDYGILLKMYDPAFPGEERTFSYVFDQANPDYGNGSFTVYQGYSDVNYNKFAVDGYGSLDVYESFDQILSDAAKDPPFSGDDKTVVNVLSHKQGQVVDAVTQEIRLELLDAQMWSQEMTVLVHPHLLNHQARTVEEYAASIDHYELSAPVEFSVNLYPGVNEINIGLLGRNATGGWDTVDYKFSGEGWDNSNQQTFFLKLPPQPVQLEITSHSDGESVTTENITLSGTIISPDLDITEVKVLLDGLTVGTFQGAVVGHHDRREGLKSFSIPVSLYQGANSFEIITKAQQSVIETLAETVPNSLPTGFITINRVADTTPGTVYVTATDSVTGAEVETLRAMMVNTGVRTITSGHWTTGRIFTDLAPGSYYIYIYSAGYHFLLTQIVLPPGEEVTVPVVLVPGPSAETLDIEFTYTRVPEYPDKPVWPEGFYYHPVTDEKYRVSYQYPGSLTSLPFMQLSGDQDALSKTLNVSQLMQPEPGDEGSFKYSFAINATQVGHPNDGWFRLRLDNTLVMNIYLKPGLNWYNGVGIIEFYPGTGEVFFQGKVGEYHYLYPPSS